MSEQVLTIEEKKDNWRRSYIAIKRFRSSEAERTLIGQINLFIGDEILNLTTDSTFQLRTPKVTIPKHIKRAIATYINEITQRAVHSSGPIEWDIKF
jgi:hypothetical protein